MEHPIFEELMSYMDGELQEERAAAVEEHLRDCPECAALLRSQTSMEAEWRDAFSYPPDEEFRSLEERLRRSMRRRPSWLGVLPVAAAVAAVLLGVRLVLWERPAEPYPPSGPAADRSVLATGTEEAATEGGGADAELPEESAGDVRVQGEPDDCDPSAESGPLPTGDLGAEAPDNTLSAGQGTAGGGGSAPSPGLGLVSGWEDGSAVCELSESEEEGELEESGVVVLESGASGITLQGGAGEDRQLSESRSLGDVGSDDGEPGEPPYPESQATVSTDEEGQDPDSLQLLREEWQDAALPAAGTSGGSGEQEERSPPLDSATEGSGAGGEGVDDILEESESVIGASFCQTATEADRVARDPLVELAFDSLGIPDSLTSALLDSLLPGWGSYIPFEYADTSLVLRASELRAELTGSEPRGGAAESQ